MPVVLREGPYGFYFYAGDRNEPVHVHVRRDNSFAKFWLDPVRFENNGGFSTRELRRIERIIVRHQKRLADEWHEYFND